MRVRHTINPFITDDAEGKDILFGLDADKAEVVVDGMQRYVSGRFEIAVSSNEDLSFGDVNDVRFLFVKADGDFDLTLDGTIGPISFKRASAATGSTARFGGECDIASANIANPSATVVLKGIWAAYGDPA
jgi:hypothetical protein